MHGIHLFFDERDLYAFSHKALKCACFVAFCILEYQTARQFPEGRLFLLTFAYLYIILHKVHKNPSEQAQKYVNICNVPVIVFDFTGIYIINCYNIFEGVIIMSKVKVSIIGATGYVGAELVRGFLGHPEVEFQYLTSRSFEGQLFSDIYPVFRGVCDIRLTDTPYETVAKESDLVVTALPHGVSSKTVPVLLENGARVIDHSGDFRYKDVNTYENSYKLVHPDPELLKEAVYGIPEFYREDLKNARLVANPGCYPTCSLIALAPFLKAGLIDTGSIIIDAVSGVSGAGRKESLPYSFCEMQENFKPYGVVGHRHTTEIEEQASFLAGEKVRLSFTPHLAPFKRGMLNTIYARPSAKFTDVSDEKINAIYKEYYKDEYFVRALDMKVLPEIKAVNGSNFIEVNGVFDKETNLIKLFSAQDNLGKGAALQAVQAFNAMFGFDEKTGLNIVRGV